MRIPFRVRSDRSLVVLRIHVDYETEKKPHQKRSFGFVAPTLAKTVCTFFSREEGLTPR